MKEGYKKTELGWIPEEWKIKKVSELCTVKGGKRLPKGYQLLDEPNGNPYIRVADMYSGGVSLDDIKYVPDEIKDSIKNYTISDKDLFISVAGTLGVVGMIPKELDGANLTENADKLCDIKINTNFFMRVLQSNIIQRIIESEKTNNAQPKLALTRIKEFLIPVPNDIEQQKITDILSTVDSQIDDTDKIIEKTKELKKGLMQRLLTKGIGHSEFKKSEVGEIPVEWEVVKINDICEIVDYRGKTPKKVDKGIFLVTAKNIGKGYIDYNSSQEYIEENDYDDVMSRGTPEIGDVLFTTEAPLGNIANVDNSNIALAQRVIKFRGDKDRLNNYYLKYYMLGERFQQDILHEATGSTVLGIKGSRLKNVLLAIPSLYEQEKIADILISVDSQISEYENKKLKLEELKKGLMQQLLTGKIRVV